MLTIKIFLYRILLHNTIKKYGRSSYKTLEQSQKIDKLILEVMNRC